MLGVIAAPQVANAQEWLKDRRYSEGIGVRAGDLELHPGIAGEVGYDSNWFLRSEKTGNNIVNGAPNAPVAGSAVLKITPSLLISTLGPRRREGEVEEVPKLRFRGSLAATYRDYFFNSSAFGKPFWGDPNSQTNLSGNADARLEILPERPWGANIFAAYARTIQPNVIGNPDISFNRNTVQGGLEVVATPGGGTLDWRLGYQASAMLFEDRTADPFDNVTHDLYTRGRWKFRPKTAFLYDMSARWLSYSSRITSANTSLHDSTPVRARIGLNGLVTPRFSFLGLVGWGAGFYRTTGGGQTVRAPNSQYDSVIGQIEGRFFLSPNPGADQPQSVSLLLSSLAVGYVRDFQNSLLGDYYGSDRGYLRLQYFFAGRALVNLEGGAGAVQYPTIFNRDGTQNHAAFTDLRADATLFGEYRFSDSFGLNTTLRFTGNFSQTQLSVPATNAAGQPANLVYDMNWKRFEAYLGARWFL